MTDNKTAVLTHFICDFRQESLPEDIRFLAKSCILDYLGVTYAGAQCVKEKHMTYLDLLVCEKGTASIIGCERKVPMHSAALLNGISAHFLELDDGSRFGMVHPGAPVISALFAAAQSFSITPELFIKGLVVGYEVAIRLAIAVQPDHKNRGFHATGTCGCIGASAALAVALDLDKSRTEAVIAAAIANAAGMLEMIENTSQLKPFNAGNAAQNAITAVLMGLAGYTGPKDPVGGKRGFIALMGKDLNESCFERGENTRYMISGIYRKPYASCRHCHSAVEAVLRIQKGNQFCLEEIDSIQVFTYKLAVFGHDHTEIQGIGSAKMSIPFSVAAALVLHSGGLDAMSAESVKNEDILQLAKKVSVEENPAFSDLAPAKRIAKLVICLKDGTTFTDQVTYPKGEPENPFTKEELQDKYEQMMTYAGVNVEQSAKLATYVDDLENSFTDLLNSI